MTLRLLIRAFFFFFGTFLHELAHFIAALLFGRPAGFSLIPRVENNRVVFGSTTAAVRYRVLHAFIAAAPLLWWLVLFLMLDQTGIPRLITGPPDRGAALVMKKMKSISPADVFLLWLDLQLLWAGKPSLQDIKVFLGGLLSPSGIVFIAAAIMLIKALQYL